MLGEYSQFERRKQDHIELALMQSNQTCNLNRFDEITLMHEALPDFDFDEIDITGMRFGESVRSPFLVSSMTAGHKDAIDINRNLMSACAKSGWAMGVGSQRRELKDKLASAEWRPLKQAYPNVDLFANLGIAQLISTNISDVTRLIDAIEAKALIIHCNPLQECIQPEGTLDFKGCWQALNNLVKKINLPIIVKETGCGFSYSTMQRLVDLGVSAIDVSGLGGTHWGRIEGHRADEDSLQKKAAITFQNWGIDTVTSVLSARPLMPLVEIWGSGGVRHGLDAAKLFALGAMTVGFAQPMLKAALVSTECIVNEMASIEYELKVAMFCTGSRILPDLKEKACL